MPRTLFVALSLAVLCDSQNLPNLPFNFPLHQKIDTSVLTDAAKNLPDIFGFAKYLPQMDPAGHEQMTKEMLKNFIQTSLSKSAEFIPEEIDLPKLDMEIPQLGQVTIDGGKVQGVSSFSEFPPEITMRGKEVDVTLKVHFNDLRVVYQNLTMEPWDITFDHSELLSVRFNSNLLVIKISGIKDNVIDRLINDECACFLTYINISDLKNITLKATFDDEVYNDHLPDDLFDLQELLTQQINSVLVQTVTDALPTEEYWICKDERLGQYLADVSEEAARTSVERKDEYWARLVKGLFM